MKQVNQTLSSIGTTIFTVMSALAVEHGSINLGQGFPTLKAPPMLCGRQPTRWGTVATSIRRCQVFPNFARLWPPPIGASTGWR
jgi:hypothetical protein